MIRLSEIKLDIEHTDGELTGAICRRLRCRESDIADYEIIRRSIDARKKPELFWVYSIAFSVGNEDAFLKKIIYYLFCSFYITVPATKPLPPQNLVVKSMISSAVCCSSSSGVFSLPCMI